MTESAAMSIEQLWESLEQPAMAELGLTRVRDDRYECPLDDTGTVVGRVTLPLERHGDAGIKLGYPAVEAVHLPTSRLLSACMPPFAPDDGALTVRLIDLPLDPAERTSYLAIAAEGPAEVPAAVDAVTGMVGGVLLPWLRERGSLDAIRAQLADPRPFERPYPRCERLRRLTAACLAAGDVAAAREAYGMFTGAMGECQGVPALDEVNDHFAGAMRERIDAAGPPQDEMSTHARHRAPEPVPPEPPAPPRTDRMPDAAVTDTGSIPAQAPSDPAETPPATARRDVEPCWIAAERESMARLGLDGPREGRYRLPLDDDGDWIGLVALPKVARSDGGVRQLVSYAAISHRPTETLLLALHGREPGGGPEPITTGVEVRDFPELAGAPIVDDRTLGSPDEVPAAVATTAALVAEQYLPWLRSWRCDLRALAAHFQADPPFTADSFVLRHLERRIVVSHLVGDAAAAKHAYDTYLDLRTTMSSPGPALSPQGVLRLITS